MTVKVLLVESHPAVCIGLRTIFRSQKSVEILGEAGSVEEALYLARELTPDVIVTELGLDEANSGLVLCKKVKSLSNAPYVIFYTAHNNTEELISCRRSEVDGYVHKSERPERLLEAIREAYCGRQKWCIGQKPEETGTPFGEDSEENVLTSREQEVFELLRRRRTSREIATALSISPHTVETHVSNIVGKSRLQSRREIS